MDSLQYAALLKHFNDSRLHPWIPEHAIFIAGEIAKLEVTDPTAAASFKKFYEDKMAKYEEENRVQAEVKEEVKPEEVTITETVVTEVVDVEKKKPGRKPKN